MSIIEESQKYAALLEHKPELGPAATFVPNKAEPVYNWLYYKEGFSKELVNWLLDYFSAQQTSENETQNQTTPKALDSSEFQLVLDPFCGVGTTLLACKQKGINSIGYDVQPAAVFASMVKTKNYDLDELKEQARLLLKKKFIRLDKKFPPLFYRAFSKYALEDIAFFDSEIREMGNNNDFFLLALINAAIKCSYVWKDGAVIKIRKAPKPPLRVMLRKTIYRMIKDLEASPQTGAHCVAEMKDARQLDLEPGIIDAVITSPPYLNNIDYTKVYEIENYFLGYPKPPLRSFIGFSDVEEFSELPASARAYFTDMKKVLYELYRVSKSSAKLAVVVGNGYVDGVIVDSDLLLAKMAEGMGFNVEKIFVVNERFALEERTKKKGVLRESIIVMEKI